MAQKLKAPQFVSFKGTLVYPKLHEVDYGSKDYPKPDGEFSTKLRGRLDDADVKAFIAKLQPLHDVAVENARAAFKELKVETRKKLKDITVNQLYTTCYDKETEEPTGEVEFKFSMKHKIEIKKGPKAGKSFLKYPAIFDAKGNLMKPVPEIWGGSVARVSFEVGIDREGQPGYFIPGTGACGLSLRLQAARIIDLVQGGARSASDYGFDGEEEGYEYSPADTTDATSEESTEGTAGGVGPSDDNPDF